MSSTKQSYSLAICCAGLGLGLGAVMMLWAERPFLLGYGFGLGLLVFNTLGLGYAWPRILGKKSVAGPIIVIVSKHAITLGVIFWLTRPGNVVFYHESGAWRLLENPWAGFSMGIALVVPAAVVLAIIYSREAQEEVSRETQEKPQPPERI